MYFKLYMHASRHSFLNPGSTSAYVKLHVSELLLQQATVKHFSAGPVCQDQHKQQLALLLTVQTVGQSG